MMKFKTERKLKLKYLTCNTDKPDTVKIAAVTGNTINKISCHQGVYYCQLNGKRTKVMEARKKMLEGVILVNLSGQLCKV